MLTNKNLQLGQTGLIFCLLALSSFMYPPEHKKVFSDRDKNVL